MIETFERRCGDCGKTFGVIVGAAETTCPHCGHKYTVLRGENSLDLVEYVAPEPEQGGSNWELLVVILFAGLLLYRCFP